MECKEFLERYSSYLDGFLEPDEVKRFERHRDGCGSCRRYDRVLRRGLEILNDLPRPDASPDFLPRLTHRIYHIQDGIPLREARYGGNAALVAVAAVGLLAVAWLPFASRMPVEVELPAVAVEVPAPRGAAPSAARSVPSLFDRGPFVAVEGEYATGPAAGPAASLLEGGDDLLAPAGLSADFPSLLTGYGRPGTPSR